MVCQGALNLQGLAQCPCKLPGLPRRLQNEYRSEVATPSCAWLWVLVHWLGLPFPPPRAHAALREAVSAKVPDREFPFPV